MDFNGMKKASKRDFIIQKDDIQFINDFGELDPWTAWVYKPRTISLLLFGSCVIMYVLIFKLN